MISAIIKFDKYKSIPEGCAKSAQNNLTDAVVAVAEDNKSCMIDDKSVSVRENRRSSDSEEIRGIIKNLTLIEEMLTDSDKHWCVNDLVHKVKTKMHYFINKIV